jgi:aldehyde:ferredoxin oxidoreductase
MKNNENFLTENVLPNLVRINMATHEIKREQLNSDHHLAMYAGRALTSKIIADEVPPTCNALGSENKFIISVGFLTGTTAPNSGRCSIGSKSPMTLGIKESNVGGRAPVLLARNNIRGLVFENQATDWVIVKIQDGDIEILDGTKYVGLNNYELVKNLIEEYGSRVGAFTIGVGGEYLFANSTVGSIDMEGFPSRHAGRGGMGAVMGSKKIKAVIVVPPSKNLMKNADNDTFKKHSVPWFRKTRNTHKRAKHVFGTPGAVSAMNELHSLPTQNYRRGQFKDVDMISGEAVHDLIIKNKGKFGLACSPGCAIQCSNYITNAKGEHVTSSLEYETIGLLGSNLLINDVLKISKMDQLCDDLGMDTIETGSGLGLFMEAGRIPWGDGDQAIKLIEGIFTKNPESMLLGLGVYELGKKLNVQRVPHVKRQAFPAYDPRALKAPGVTFLSGPMGADHTAGDVAGNNAHMPEGKLVLAKERQILTFLVDSMGLCYFIGPSLEVVDILSDLMKARYGDYWFKSRNDWVQWGWEGLIMERDFNTKAGLEAIDTLPDFMLAESLEEIDYKWDFDKKELNSYWDAVPE